MNFFDPALTSDGLEYAPQRLKEIIRERYIISKRLNTSYYDLGKITPFERTELLKLIKEEVDKEDEAFKKIKSERQQPTQPRR